MSHKDYSRMILERLLKKYTRRNSRSPHALEEAGNSPQRTGRRILVRPTEFYKNYAENNADLAEKQRLHEAVEELLGRAFVTADRLKFSEDIEKIYLREEKLDAVYAYLREEYAVVPQSVLYRQAEELLAKYDRGELTGKYCESIRQQLENSKNMLEQENIGRMEANLRMLELLEHNTEELYVREASMLVYGDSKWFEKNNYEEICSFLRKVRELPKEEKEKNDAVLSQYHIISVEQEIFLKGAWRLEWEDFILDTEKLQGGIALASGDLQTVRRILVSAPQVMTVENKTSYQRMKTQGISYMYLGGFANRQQILFLQKVMRENPNVTYMHFGDIDAGGLLIHRHLCSCTGIDFQMYGMGIEQLTDPRFAHSLKTLSDSDEARLETLAEEKRYAGLVAYMRTHHVKLEQEIISYYCNSSAIAGLTGEPCLHE